MNYNTDTTSIRVELGINAQKFTQMIRINNESIEEQISKGIQLALDELTKEDNFVDIIKQATKKELIDIAKKVAISWEMRLKIEEIIKERVNNKVEEYAIKVASEITKDL